MERNEGRDEDDRLGEGVSDEISGKGQRGGKKRG